MEKPKTTEQLKEDFKQQHESRKKRLQIYRQQLYDKASFSDKMKMIIRSWFEKKD
jgi:hypothetical protein